MWDWLWSTATTYLDYEGISVSRRGPILVRTCTWVLLCATVLVSVAARPSNFMCGEMSECEGVGRNGDECSGLCSVKEP